MRVRARHLVLFVIAVWAGVVGVASARSGVNTPGSPVAVTVDPSTTVGHIRPGFLGVSIEYWAFEYSAGKHLNDLDSVFLQLIRNLEQDHKMVLRIGGGSSDTTWWPVHGFKRPPGVNYSLSPTRLAIMRAVAQQLGVRLMLGINFAANSLTLAAAEARAMVSQIGASRINSLEFGNEPELYGNPAFPWYHRANGTPVPARQPPYDLNTFIGDFRHYGARFPRVPLAGPASNGGTWLGTNLSKFIASEPRLGVVTMHRYPFQACFVDPASQHFPTFARMLSPAASIGQAQGVQPYVAAAHAHHLPFVVDEMNTISCGDPPGMANTFAMALWALDTLFAHAQVGVDTVDIHTWPGAIYRLFTNCDWPSTPIHCRPFNKPTPGWQAMVEPEYYGLLMFSRAAPTGSHLLATTSSNAAVRAWATKARNGTVRIVLINDDMSSPHTMSVGVSGATSQATEEQLLAPSVRATSGVTLGGQSFASPTHTGLLTGQRVTATVSPSSGVYTVRLAAGSAALLTLG
jgi:hypothetical protein